MPRPKPRTAQMHEVIISREGRAFTISFRDGSLGPHQITVREDIRGATDAELLDKYNDVVRAMQQLREANPYFAVEVPPGSPQIRYAPLSDQWVPRGDVLRCEIEDSGPDGEAVIVIDDQRLSLEEFGGLLKTYNGWGMRISFVPDDELETEPEIVIEEPDE